MSDGPSKLWLPDATLECPVDAASQRWIESSLRWFADEFGAEVLSREAVLPTAEFLCDLNYSALPGQIELLIEKLCGLMLVDRGLIRLELFEGSSEEKEAEKRGKTRTVGHFRMEEGRAIIALDRSESADPKLLTAIAVHELCHLRLQGENRINHLRPDGERLTDLLTVYFGFGIFSTNAAMRFARSERGWAVIPQGQLDDRTLNAARNEGYRRLGYLSSPEFGYALSCYCWLRRETDPGWARYVDPGPRARLQQGLAYLARASGEGELPTQRLLNRSVKIGNATVSITRGRVSPGSSGLIPKLSGDRISDNASRAGQEAAGTSDADLARSLLQTALQTQDALLSARMAFRAGNTLAAAQDITGARTAFEHVIGLAVADYAPRAGFNLGLLLSRAGDSTGAIAAFRVAAESGHGEAAPKAAVALAELLERAGDTAGARAALEQAAESSDPEAMPQAAAHLVRLYAAAGDVDAARAAYQRAIDTGHERSAVVSTKFLADLLASQGELDEAIAAYRRVLDSGDRWGVPLAALGLGKALQQVGDMRAAKSAYKRALRTGSPEVQQEAKQRMRSLPKPPLNPSARPRPAHRTP